jgi:hypothetical protein
MLKYQQSLCESRCHSESNLISAASAYRNRCPITSTRMRSSPWAEHRSSLHLPRLFQVQQTQSRSQLLQVAENLLAMQEVEELEARQLADDKRAVNHELKRYEDDDVITSMPTEPMTDLVCLWEVSSYSYSNIYIVLFWAFLLSDQRTCLSVAVSRCNGRPSSTTSAVPCKESSLPVKRHAL